MLIIKFIFFNLIFHDILSEKTRENKFSLSSSTKKQKNPYFKNDISPDKKDKFIKIIYFKN